MYLIQITHKKKERNKRRAQQQEQHTHIFQFKRCLKDYGLKSLDVKYIITKYKVLGGRGFYKRCIIKLEKRS